MDTFENVLAVAFRDDIAGYGDGWSTVWTPLPPWPYIAPGPYRLKIRLQSTRAGNYARWFAGREALDSLNDAPHQPIVRALVKNFAWAPPATRDTRGHWLPEIPYNMLDKRMIVQYGSGVPNWQCEVIEPITDPLAEIFQGLHDYRAEHEEEPERQGSLEVWQRGYSLPTELPLEKLPKIGSRSRWFFNHLLSPAKAFAYRVYSDAASYSPPVAYGVLVPASQGTWILSPDHPDPEEGIFIRFPAMLRHPLPQPDRGVD